MPRNNKKVKSAPLPRPRGPGKPSGPSSNPAKGQQHGNGQKQGNATANAPKKASMQANQRPIVPFLRKDRILLIGEGDFSFGRSLAKQYKCRNLCATCYDSKEALYDKYPQAPQNVSDILSASAKPKPAMDETEKQPEESKSEEQDSTNPNQQTPKVIFSVDARKLGAPAGGGKEIRTGFTRRERKRPAWYQQNEPAGPPYQPGGPWDVICFNFPHVGGLSTDVNRQVRANQELLVAFFKACVPLVSKPPPLMDAEDDEWVYADGEESEEEDEDEDEDQNEEGGEGEGLGKDDDTTGKGFRTGPGQILVTLFEGEPYTLWNIKDLARHAGLVVVTSFRFPWTSYEGYSHARTVGHIEGKDGERGGWRGEDREARMYVFEVKQKEPAKKGGKKRNRDDDSSDSE
ncbi:unnamed protein product [Penicillium nalgiovense]|uniref:25S rRNA (uridine-N(3))-methyltransferase BMT5-like domain-containing protein n=1 Tax=Penicillium nalgiovense TaxID=60175 RepID=A0A1V6YN60_PENNA|nr:hypothetical protein PENNAL_c0015G07149 [Penicillium nalgiovense]CAG7934916.1 unnamed protein product [Penicillium nalgiovense]CAG7937648.1 unnamed protein product [Penicillium nalgiovense]CAG7939490.1 unnamed protein product [Penicillium nalgiovense]CAG7941253.1 unnamed protein product [Penicillium nalgiovense]